MFIQSRGLNFSQLLLSIPIGYDDLGNVFGGLQKWVMG